MIICFYRVKIKYSTTLYEQETIFFCYQATSLLETWVYWFLRKDKKGMKKKKKKKKKKKLALTSLYRAFLEIQLGD